MMFLRGAGSFEAVWLGGAAAQETKKSEVTVTIACVESFTETALVRSWVGSEVGSTVSQNYINTPQLFCYNVS